MGVIEAPKSGPQACYVEVDQKTRGTVRQLQISDYLGQKNRMKLFN